jgi:hypothetical protein
MRLFKNVVTVAFQSVFLPKYTTIIFLKKLFLKSAHQNDPKHIKKINFF